jgi:uncharacterized protein YkwD
MALLAPWQPEAAAGYREDAESLVARPPAGIVIRPDLEGTIDGLANAARASEGRKPLSASPLFKSAARAQAIDMALGDFVGHRSRKGHGFTTRFAAFAGDADRFPARGENAARDRANGPVDGDKARRLFQQWLDSGGHRRNLLGRNYEMVSSGVIQKGNHMYAVQIFWAALVDTGIEAGSLRSSAASQSGKAIVKPAPKRSILKTLRALWPL